MTPSISKLILDSNKCPTINYLPKVRWLGFSYAHLLHNSIRNEKMTSESMTQPKESHMQIDTLCCQQKELGHKGEQRLYVLQLAKRHILGQKVMLNSEVI